MLFGLYVIAFLCGWLLPSGDIGFLIEFGCERIDLMGDFAYLQWLATSQVMAIRYLLLVCLLIAIYFLFVIIINNFLRFFVFGFDIKLDSFLARLILL